MPQKLNRIPNLVPVLGLCKDLLLLVLLSLLFLLLLLLLLLVLGCLRFDAHSAFGASGLRLRVLGFIILAMASSRLLGP